MLLRSGVALVIAAVFAQSVPDTRALIRLVRGYVERYQQDFIELVAEEHTTQQVQIAEAVTATRETRGELFATFLPREGAWMSVHDIMEVDGAPVSERANVRAMLARESIDAVAHKVADANARYNIGSVIRNFNEPTLGLLPFTRRYIDRFTFTRGAIDRSRAETTLVTLELSDREPNAIVRSFGGGRVRLRGSAVIDAATGRVEHTSITLSDGTGTATLDTTFAFDAHVGCWVPVTFHETYTRPALRETTTVRTALSNYRRFGVSVQIR